MAGNSTKDISLVVNARRSEGRLILENIAIQQTNLSNNSEANPTQPGSLPQGKWSHLSRYELKCFRERIRAYDEITQLADDVPEIANRYQVSAEDVRRAKDYAFGTGVSKYRFTPDNDMAAAWKRMASGNGTDIDEVLLRHEILESALVIERGMAQKEAHDLAQARYPWSILLKQKEEL